ncbi:MAG: type II toxin-antitoxin system VapC family toxin [Holophagales bacterium]|nr:type II toxin-antitoxin system VapC family toxin [Holophagales bacterium]MYC11998.1 type II toxin-antitoxin system VapC family toxin [Holophagales bacterium]
MKLLLDTCVFLWWTLGSTRIPGEVRKLVADPANEVHVSAITAWELAVKHGLGKLELPAPPHVFVPTRREWYDFRSLPIDEASALQLPRLPPLHGDPFDRLLICQAIEHGMTLLTPDHLISQYPVRIFW